MKNAIAESVDKVTEAMERLNAVTRHFYFDQVWKDLKPYQQRELLKTARAMAKRNEARA